MFKLFKSGHAQKVSTPYSAVTGRDMENYFAQVKTMCEPYANPFCYYEALIDELNDIPSLNMLDGANFANCCEKDKLHVFLRHDVDSDPITALKAARYLARVGRRGSFYLLHTSPYYAECYNDVVVRNPALIHWIHGFIVSGCEVGLHNDAHGVQKLWGLDGVTAIREELSWLRSQGLNISGTVAHNSGPAYGTENYEILKGGACGKEKPNLLRLVFTHMRPLMKLSWVCPMREPSQFLKQA